MHSKNKDSLPYILLKYASSINGIIGSNSDTRLVLSNEQDSLKVMQLRSEMDAILIGAGTLIKDNPRLTVRTQELVEKRINLGLKPQPTRIIIANREIKEKNLNLLSDCQAETILFSPRIDTKLNPQIKQIKLNNQENPLLECLQILKILGIESVLIEGGAKIISEVLRLKIADKIRILYSPLTPNEGVKIGIEESINLNPKDLKIEKLGNQFALNITNPFHAR